MPRVAIGVTGQRPGTAGGGVAALSKPAHTHSRIEMVKLLSQLRQGDEKPGQTILRALRKLASETPARHPREIPMPAGFTLLETGRICHLDDPDCRHPDCDCARYMAESLATKYPPR